MNKWLNKFFGTKCLRSGARVSTALLIGIAAPAYMPVHAQVYSLDSVMAVIDRNSPMLEEYDYQARALEEYASGAKSWMAPMVGGGTFMTPYRNQNLMEGGDRGSWMLSLEQEIPNPAKLRARKDYLESRADVARENRKAQFTSLRAQAKQHYYRWLVAVEKLRVLREGEHIVDLMLRLARIRYPYNQSSLGDIYKAEGQLGEIQNSMLSIEGDIEASRAALKSLMSVPEDERIMIDTTASPSINIDEIVSDTAALSHQRSDIRQIDETIRTMRLNQRLQESQARPDFKIRFDHMQPFGNMPAQFSAMAMMSIPIAPWASKMYRSEIRGMEYDIAAMRKQKQGILIEARGMLAGMADQLKRIQQQLENYETKIVPALRKNYETLMLAYEENRGQMQAVIEAWEALNAAQMEFLEKKESYYLMIADYERELDK